MQPAQSSPLSNPFFNAPLKQMTRVDPKLKGKPLPLLIFKPPPFRVKASEMRETDPKKPKQYK